MRLTPFECSQCGECCSHLGLVHVIVEQRGEYGFLVRNQYTGEKTAVTIDPDKARLFLDRSIFTDRPEACPFFRFVPQENKGYCTVHLTRPEICRDYGCWKILILRPDGSRAGRIMGSRYLVSEDERLSRFFREEVDTLDIPEDPAWDLRVTGMLEAAGYLVRT